MPKRALAAAGAGLGLLAVDGKMTARATSTFWSSMEPICAPASTTCGPPSAASPSALPHPHKRSHDPESAARVAVARAMAACVELGRDPIYDPSKNEGFHYGAPLADIMAACDVHDWQTALLLDYVVANNAHRPTKRVARAARARPPPSRASAGTSSARRTTRTCPSSRARRAGSTSAATRPATSSTATAASSRARSRASRRSCASARR